MSYSICFSKEADSDIDRLYHSDKKLFARIMNKIESLENHPKEGKPLLGNHAGEFSITVGNYRIVYEPEHARNVIHILTIKHRKHVY